MKQLLMCSLLFFSTQAFAYYETLNNAEVVPNGTLRTIFATQAGLSRHKGINLSALADMGISKDSDARFTFGIGKVDFSFGGFYKWAPVPDIDGQPGMALISGVSYANISNSSEFTASIQPLISEDYDSKIGEVIVHTGLSLGLMSRSGDDEYPITYVVGAELFPSTFDWYGARFMSEFNISLNDSFTSFVVAVVFDFDNLSFVKVVTDRENKNAESTSDSAE